MPWPRCTTLSPNTGTVCALIVSTNVLYIERHRGISFRRESRRGKKWPKSSRDQYEGESLLRDPGSDLTLLEPQSRFGDKPLTFQVVCPQNGTAALKGLTTTQYSTMTGGA